MQCRRQGTNEIADPSQHPRNFGSDRRLETGRLAGRVQGFVQTAAQLGRPRVDATPQSGGAASKSDPTAPPAAASFSLGLRRAQLCLRARIMPAKVAVNDIPARE
jgi:hypothetical protein